MNKPFMLSSAEVQNLIDFFVHAYSPEEIFGLGRNIGISKSEFYSQIMTAHQLAETFIEKVIQRNKVEELINTIRTHEEYSRPSFSSIFEERTNADTEGHMEKGLMHSLFAVVIGVDEYNDTVNFGPLRYAQKDAKDIQQVLIKQWKVNPDNILLINEPRYTTYDKVNKLMTNLITKMTRDDCLLFYFSGHGDEIDGKSNLILSDTVLVNNEYQNAIELNALNDLFRESKARIKIRVFDACKCGQSFSKGRSKTMSEKFRTDMFGSGTGWVTFTSCNIDQNSDESNELTNGVFTHFFLKGLEGEARREKDKMYIEDLKIYVSNEVPKYSNYEQNPQFQCEVDGNIFIG